MARSSDAAFPLSLIRDKAFEMRQIRRVLFLALFFIVQSTLVLGFFYHIFLGNLVAGNAPVFFVSEDISSVSDAVPTMSTVLKQWMLVMVLINAAVTAAISVYVLRRMGSPVLAMRRVLNEVGDGNLNTRLRENDSQEFAELSVAFNHAMAQVTDRIHKAQELTDIVDSRAEQPRAEDAGLIEAMTECREVLNYFDRAPANDDGLNTDTPRYQSR